MIQLRDVNSTDKATLFRWRNMPDVAKYMYTNHVISEKEHAKWFQNIFGDQHRRYWIIQCDQEDVGLVNLYQIDFENKRASWAFYLASPNIRGKGVGSFVEYSMLKYAFDELQLNKLCCEVLKFNSNVIGMHKSFGFTEEGIYRQHILKGSKFEDIVSLGILREEWIQIRPSIEARLKEKGNYPFNLT